MDLNFKVVIAKASAVMATLFPQAEAEIVPSPALPAAEPLMHIGNYPTLGEVLYQCYANTDGFGAGESVSLGFHEWVLRDLIPANDANDANKKVMARFTLKTPVSWVRKAPHSNEFLWLKNIPETCETLVEVGQRLPYGLFYSEFECVSAELAQQRVYKNTLERDVAQGKAVSSELCESIRNTKTLIRLLEDHVKKLFLVANVNVSPSDRTASE